MFVEERAPDGTLLRRTALRSVRLSSSQPACTLGVGQSFWTYSQDGMPSRSADGRVGMVPCFDINEGSRLDLYASKVIALIYPNSSVAYVGPITNAYQGILGSPGYRQVASADGRSFYLAGYGSSNAGFRYVAGTNATQSSLLSGSATVPAPNAIAVAVYNGQLYGSGGDSWAGLYALGPGSGNGLPTPPLAEGDFTALTGVPPLRTFVFEDPQSIWLLLDDARGIIAHYVLSPFTSSWVLERSVTAEPYTMSIAGNFEFIPSIADWAWVVYAASASRLWRYEPVNRWIKPIYNMSSDYPNFALLTSQSALALRGVMPAPVDSVAACIPTITRTASVTPSNSPTPSITPSNTPSSSQTATGRCVSCFSRDSFM